MDLPGKYFLEVIQAVFHNHSLATGTMVVNGRQVDLGLISQMGLLTIEGQFDETVGPGQTRAALALCSGIAEQKKKNVVVPGANHYSLIYGSTWNQVVLPEVLDFMRQHES